MNKKAPFCKIFGVNCAMIAVKEIYQTDFANATAAAEESSEHSQL
jgi:hypothetical protein